LTPLPPLDFQSDLNPEQLAAVTHGDGPQLVLAGAGSGKTRVITYRIAWLVGERGVDPGAIVAVTFTNKAAEEMRGRVERLLGLYPLPTFVGTFHRFALSLLRRHGERVGLRPGFAIFDAADQITLVKKALAAEGLDESAFAPRSVLAAISSAKNKLLDPASYERQASGFFAQRVARVYRRYQGMLVESAGVDFDDMLRLAVRLLVEEPQIREGLARRVEHLLVDEFQDTNHAQMRLVREVIGERGNLTAVGDEDQGIYRWRGADLDNVLEFEKSYPGATVRKLERNYRSTGNILSAAGHLVEHNQRRRGKRLWTAAGDGGPVEVYKARDDQDEARWVVTTLRDLAGEMQLREMAILVRTNAQTRAFEEELLRREMPYVLVGGVRFYERAEIKDLLAYLRLALYPKENLSLSRVLNQPPRGIGRATRQMLERVAEEHGNSLWQALCHSEMSSFPARSARALEGFRDLIVELQTAAAEVALPELLERVLEATGYADLFRGDDAEAQSRLENIREFLTAAREFDEAAADEQASDRLTAFLDHVSLVSDLDGYERGQGVSLMTLHSAKGLEFRCAVIGGLEDGLLPHFNTRGEPEDLEEERRLLYVGMTRAEERLLLSCCRRRRIAGRYQDREESPFLLELPPECLDIHQSPELFHGPQTRGAFEFFGRSAASEPEMNQEVEGQLQRGRRVRHPTLGEGTLLNLEGEGEHSKLTVFFDRVGKRKLVAKFANLQLL
jgi:DNA helicase-2/ATP-dependent DNA helicase PcrA